MTNEEKVKAKYPDADLSVDCSRYEAWFRIIRTSEKNTFWKPQESYGTGRTTSEAWEDAAKRLDEGVTK